MLLGTSGTALAIGPDEIDVQAAAGWRALFGAVGLAAIVGFAPSRGTVAPSSWPIVLAGGGTFAVNQLVFFTAIDRIGVAAGTLGTVATVPIAAGLIDWWQERRPPTTQWWLGVGAALIGVAAMTLDGSQIRLDLVGIAAAVLAGATAAIVAFCAQRLMSTSGMPLAMASIIAIGAMLLLPLTLNSLHAVATLGGIVTVGWLGFVTLTAGYSLVGVGLAHHPLRVVGVVTLLEPAVAAVLAVTIAGEPATGGLFVGLLLVVLGIGVAGFRRSGAARSLEGGIDRGCDATDRR